MFHVFHKGLLKSAEKAAEALKKGDYSTGFTLCEKLSEDLLNLSISREHEKYKEIQKAYSGIGWDKFDETTEKLDELCDESKRFLKVVSDVDDNKEYRTLSAELNNIIILLEWFEDNADKLIKQCGGALEDMSSELKEIEHIKKLLEQVE